MIAPKVKWTGSHQWVITTGNELWVNTGNNWTFNPSSNQISFLQAWKKFHFRVENISLVLISNEMVILDAFFLFHRLNISAPGHLKISLMSIWPEIDGRLSTISLILHKVTRSWCHDDEMSYQWLHQLSWNSSYSKTPWNINKIILQNIWFNNFSIIIFTFLTQVR